MTFKSFFMVFLLMIFSIRSIGQSDVEQLSRLEQYIENTDQAWDYNDLAEQVFGITNKINLNKAGAFEFLSLNILTPVQVRAIIKHRMEFGAFISPLELQTIDEIPL